MNINGRTANDTETGVQRYNIPNNDTQLSIMSNDNLLISEQPKPLTGVYIKQNRSPKGSMNSHLALAWINLSYYGTKLCGKSGQPILNQLKGQIDFGTLTALMGPSGSGKTTLLRCINGVNMDGIGPQTEIYVSKYVAINPCYIQQDVQQHLLMSLNVSESLNYASKLKNRRDKSVATKHINLTELIHKKNIENLLNDLLLTDCANTTVSRCSGGEQKRLIIAMELTALIKPNLICIDEPTSGLDSNAAEQTMLCLQNIARKHSLAIVTSIHQPNSDVLRMFDQLYVLAKGGRCIFSGPPYALKNHLRHCNIECREDQTPIEVLLKIASKRVKTLNCDEVVIELGPPDDVMSLVLQTYDNMKSLKTECVTEAKKINCEELTGNNVRIHPIDMFYLLQRFATFTYLKQWKLSLAQFVIHLILVFVFITLYRSDIGNDANCPLNVTELFALNSTLERQIMESLAEQNTKFLFFLVLMISFLQMCASVLTFPLEIQIFFNEHRNRWYSSGSYFWPKAIVDIPLIVVTVYFYTWIGYYFTSQPDMDHWYGGMVGVSARYALFALIIFMIAVNIQGLSMISGIIFAGDFRLAMICAVIALLLNVLFCGIYIPIEGMPAFYKGVQHITYMKHCIDSMLIVIFGRGRCGGPQSTSLSLTASNISEDDFWWKLLWIAIHSLVYRVIALCAIYIKANGVQRFFKVKKFKACLQL